MAEFWGDLQKSLTNESYFLGLVILTDEDSQKHVVDGQQRILTLTLLAAALYHTALEHGRNALAERIRSDFLYSIDYKTDATFPRVKLSDESDNKHLENILKNGECGPELEKDSLSVRMIESFRFLRQKLRSDLTDDPFKRLGLWTEFITNRLYFAVFVHPDSAAAYQVFEVINTRGRELTTADLLKNYILSQTPAHQRDARYLQWQNIARPFSAVGQNALVQFIRHVVTVEAGHILPKDLFGFLAQRTNSSKPPPSPAALMEKLEESLPLYAQMIDPSLDGPAEPEVLKIFAALNSLGVIAVRPILLAMSKNPDSTNGMRHILQLVVRRMSVGNLGTGNVERRFGEAAKSILESHDWRIIERSLSDLNPPRSEFVDQVSRRSFNKGTLTFLRHSIVERTITPNATGTLHFITTRQQAGENGLSEEDASYWMGTLANTYISNFERRPKEVVTWNDFKERMLPHGIEGEWRERLGEIPAWDAITIEELGKELAKAAGNVWY